MILYRLEQVQQAFAGRTVLDIESLLIEEGKIYALLGANGAGKTTLFNIMAFLQPSSGGTIEFAGTRVGVDAKTLQQLRRQVVMVDQHPILFTTTVFKNIEFGLKIRKIDKAMRERIIDEVLELVDLREFKHALSHGLSGGEIQRIALARALALSAKVLLCDEPTSSVDVENQAAIAAILNRINEEKRTTILFTTHDRLQAAGLAQHTLVLEKGRLVSTTYENVYTCEWKSQGDRLFCQLQNSISFLLPKGISYDHSGKNRVYLDPEKIALEPAPEAEKGSGVLAGTVVMLMEEGGKIRVVVNTGVIIVVLIKRQQYQQQRPLIGDSVWLHCGVDAIRAID